jgi:hypothetical protein
MAEGITHNDTYMYQKLLVLESLITVAFAGHLLNA